MSKQSDAARDFFKTLAAGPVAPVYYVHGEESYLLDKSIEAILKRALPHGANDFNYELFYGKDVDVEQLYASVETLSFMGGMRVVVLRDLQDMDLRQFAALEAYFKNPSPTTCLIVHAMTASKSVDGRQGVVKKLKKAATVAEFKAFYENDAEQFVRKQAHVRGMALDAAAAAFLVEAVGTGLAQLDMALDRLDLYLGASAHTREVGRDAVSNIITQTRVNTVFELTDALGDRRLEDALSILERTMHMGEPAIKLNQMIARHFRILLKLKDPSIRNAGKSERAKAVGVSPFFLKDYQRHANKFSVSQLKEIMTDILEVDVALKSSKLKDQTIMERMILDLVLRTKRASS